MIEVKAPGKIMLAGEWSILEPGHSCIVLPVNKFVTARIQESKKIIFNSDYIGLKNVVLRWSLDHLMSHLIIESSLSEQLSAKFNICFCAIKNCLQFLTEQGVVIKPFELSVCSELSCIKIDDSNFSKPGLGSSAAVTVAVCKAILKFHDFDIDSVCHPDLDSGSINCITFHNLELVFKLACLSHYFASGKLGSGFDIACSTYQKPLVYSRFDQIWLDQKLTDLKKISEVVLLKWPTLKIKEIKLPENMHVLIGFVGSSSSTLKMIEKMQKFRQQNLVFYKKIMAAINSVVFRLVRALENCDQVEIINLINQNRDFLANLGAESCIEIETKKLGQLIEIAKTFGAAAKFSGAGGGDCGIAVCFDKIVVAKITDEWNIAGIKSI
ncbi:MAG: hypothetical protein V1646_03260 [bacterium]